MLFTFPFFFFASLCGVSALAVPSGYSERTITRADGTNATAYLREDFVPTTDHQFRQVQDRQLHKRFYSDFYSTQDHQYLCAFQSDYCNTDYDSPVTSDCELLMDVLLETPRYWVMGDWSVGAFEPLTFLETCIVAVSRTDDHYKEQASVGDGDVYAWLARTAQNCKGNFNGIERAGSVGTYLCPGQHVGDQARIIGWVTGKIH